MSKTKRAGQITGKISASPNPIYFGQGGVRISWETNDPAGAEVRVSTCPGDERLVSKSKGRSGQTEISWIVDSTTYEFRLYAASQPDTAVDSVAVRRALDSVPVALREIADEAIRGNVNMAELSRFIAALIPVYLRTGKFGQVFPVLLHQLAIDAVRGGVGETELSQFIGTAIPEYLDSAIAGKIVATPNPVPFGEDVLITWGTNDPGGGEVRLLTSSGDEKLITRQPSGQMKIPWITGLTAHEFRLYASSRPDTPIDSVKVGRDVGSTPAIMSEIGNEVARGNIDLMELSQFIARVVPHCLHSKKFHEIFQIWEKRGFHVTPVHFYQPIPDTQNLSKTLWEVPSELVGIDMNESMQLDLLRNHFPRFRNEYEQFPNEPTGKAHHFHLNNRLFDGTDALVAYGIVRHFQPRLIIEVGGGFSTLLLAEAAAKNNTSALICIEPFPQEFLKQGFPGLLRLIEKKVQDVELEFFSELHSGDVLFIDSSHTVKIGGDVNYLFLEVLPRLEPGVIVHIHDIFFPFEYHRNWVLDEFRFWSEQYLLQAFLAFNSEFEVLMANDYASHYHRPDLQAAFPNLSSLGGGSFWMRRKPRC